MAVDRIQFASSTTSATSLQAVPDRANFLLLLSTSPGLTITQVGVGWVEEDTIDGVTAYFGRVGVGANAGRVVDVGVASVFAVVEYSGVAAVPIDASATRADTRTVIARTGGTAEGEFVLVGGLSVGDDLVTPVGTGWIKRLQRGGYGALTHGPLPTRTEGSIEPKDDYVTEGVGRLLEQYK